MEEKRTKGVSQRYADILSNGGFKAFFGDENNKREVMTLINTLLPEHRRVTDIEYRPPHARTDLRPVRLKPVPIWLGSSRP